jgi:uncharacterized membrane protein YedE/YeeE
MIPHRIADDEDMSAAGPSSQRLAADGVRYVFAGVYFGIVLTKSEVISWYRVQEMFRFQAFHMYGIIASAVIVSAVSLLIIRRYGVKTLGGEPIVIPPKAMGRGYRYWIGGGLFGVGWALTGACPGPLFALVGNGVSVIAVAIVSAIAGTWTYGYLRPRLPH